MRVGGGVPFFLDTADDELIAAVALIRSKCSQADMKEKIERPPQFRNQRNIREGEQSLSHNVAMAT